MALSYKSSYVRVSDEDCADGTGPISAETHGFGPTVNIISEKNQPTCSGVVVEQLGRRSIGIHERLQCLKYSLRLQLLVLLVCGVGLVLFAGSSLSCDIHPETNGVRLSYRGHNQQPAVEETYISRSKSSSSPVLEVFQVYQPVLAPSGPTDQTIESDGSSNTTTIGSAETSVSCTQLLMEYSFGFSYGHPFVGMFLCSRTAV
jgi:hypothetical protein